MAKLTHLDDAGNARMVEVGSKPITDRKAVAEGFISLSKPLMDLIRTRDIAKGDVLTIAQLAGIQSAKRASDLIPLCHPIPLTGVDVEIRLVESGAWVQASVRASWRTGVEMEALTAVSTTLLTMYDMLKAVEKGIEIGPIRLMEKSGGRSGEWNRASK